MLSQYEATPAVYFLFSTFKVAAAATTGGVNRKGTKERKDTMTTTTDLPQRLEDTKIRRRNDTLQRNAALKRATKNEQRGEPQRGDDEDIHRKELLSLAGRGAGESRELSCRCGDDDGFTTKARA